METASKAITATSTVPETCCFYRTTDIMESANKDIARTPTVPALVPMPARPVKAVPMPGATTSAPSATNVVLGSSSYAAKAPNRRLAAIPPAVPVNKASTAREVDDPGTWSTAVEEMKKMEITSKDITGTPTVPCSTQMPARATQQVQIPGALSSATSAVDAVVAAASIRAAPPAGKEKTAVEVELLRTWSRVAKQQAKVEDSIKAANEAASNKPRSASRMLKTPAPDYVGDAPHHDAQATPLSGASSLPPKVDNVVLKSGSNAVNVGPTIPPPVSHFGRTAPSGLVHAVI